MDEQSGETEEEKVIGEVVDRDVSPWPGLKDYKCRPWPWP